MSLPKIMHPVFQIEIPSTKQKVTFRPFLVKEEKILLIAKTSGMENDIFKAIKQIINNCAIDDSFDANKLTVFDMEYVFLKLRSSSVDNVVTVVYNDYEDKKDYTFDVDLNAVTMVYPENVQNAIKISDQSGLSLKYPQASLYDDIEFLQSGDESFYQLIIRCIDKIYDGEDMYDASTFSSAELQEYLEQLDVKTFEKIRDFMINQPTMSYTIKYKNSFGNDRQIDMRTLSDFFTLR
jgi:hypothetical protein